MVVRRVKAYALRSAHWRLNGNPESLADHVQQEQYVASRLPSEDSDCSVEEQARMATMFGENMVSIDHSLILIFSMVTKLPYLWDAVDTG